MRAQGFTLVEVLIVVVILSILAAIIVPQLSSASATTRASMLADDLRVLRSQIEVFKSQHKGVPPGYPDCDEAQAPTEDAFLEQMTMASTAGGDVANPGTEGFDYGPYMLEMVPNPVNSKATIEIIGDGEDFPSEADDSHGFIYQPSTTTLRADSTGTDDSGRAFFDY